MSAAEARVEGREPAGVEESGTWFPFGRAYLRGLPAVYWVFLLYLFLTTSYVDEEWAFIGSLHLRPLSAIVVLLALVHRGLLRVLVPVTHKDGRPQIEAAGAFAAPGSRWLFLFLLAGFLTWVWAYDRGNSGPAQIEHAKQVLAFFAVCTLFTSRRRLLLAILVILAGSGVYLLRAFMEYLSGKHAFTMGVNRMLGTGTSYEDPNSFAATVVFGLVLVIWAAIHARSRLLRLCGVAYFLLGSVCVIYARSRSGFVLLVLALGWSFFSLPSRRMKVVLALAVAILAVSLAGMQSKAAMERFTGIFSSKTYSTDSSTYGRIEGYLVSWDIFQRKPVFGVGPMNWGLYRARHIDGNKHEPHNLGGQLLATRGLAGGVTFLGFLLVTIGFAVRTFRARRRAEDPWDRAVAGLASAVLATLALLFVSGLAAHNLDRPQWYLLPALLAAAVLHGDRRNPRAADSPPWQA